MSSGSLLTARKVAELLEVSPATVLRWTRHGELPGVKLPSGALRYAPDELARWLADRATPEARSVEPTARGRSNRVTLLDVEPFGSRWRASRDGEE